MTPTAFVLAVGASVIMLAVLGPWLLRCAAPGLVRMPRLAIAVVSGSVVIWLGAALSLGPMLAWVTTGPAMLPARAAEVCQRCLAKANPFDQGGTETAVPAILLLAIPFLIAVALATSTAGQLIQRARRSQRAARELLQDAHTMRLHGQSVGIVPSTTPFALTFPTRHGGIVLSEGALSVLDEQELQAVLAHENAHLSQHHHAILGLLTSLTRSLGWIPLIRAAGDALPHYLEIAADTAASRHAGTPALVNALIKLGERPNGALATETGTGVLHAAGPERIRQLVSPASGSRGLAPAVVVASYVVALLVVSAAVHLPYASATLTGC